MDPLDGTNSKANAPLTGRSSSQGIAADLIAVLVAVTSGEPRVLTIQDQRALPSGPFELAHRSLQSGLRAWVERQTQLPLGYVEQLYTFADRDRAGAATQHAISISYLGLTLEQPASGEYKATWRGWYDYFPWEDHRAGPPPLIEKTLQPGLKAWVSAASGRAAQRIRRQRAAMLFGFEEHGWNEELVLQRYELLYEARLIPEAIHGNTPTSISAKAVLSHTPGKPMILDHRRILATGIARLRAKIKYHPVVFELMPDTFTLLQLQRCVEALAGKHVHKPNFRRLIEQQELIEETGETSQDTGGRPAKLFRFRRAVFAERAITGTKLPISDA
jgi:hypothetical protein